jgi:hypothetical protein
MTGNAVNSYLAPTSTRFDVCRETSLYWSFLDFIQSFQAGSYVYLSFRLLSSNCLEFINQPTVWSYGLDIDGSVP